MSNQYLKTDAMKESTHADHSTQHHAEKEERRRQKRALRRSSPFNGWIGGGALIVVGLAFLVRNVLGWELTNNWWAIFLLIPALSALATAWHFHKSDQPHMRRAAFGSMVGGGFMLIIAAALFLDIGLQLVWPLFLIVIGLSIIWHRQTFTNTNS